MKTMIQVAVLFLVLAIPLKAQATRVAVINPDAHRVLKMADLVGEINNASYYYSLASATVADGDWSDPSKWSGIGVHNDFIGSTLAAAGFQVDYFDAASMPALSRSTYAAVIVQDPLRTNRQTIAKSSETSLPDLLQYCTNQQFLDRIRSFWQSGGGLILVGDAVRLLENGTGRLGLGKSIATHSIVNTQSQSDSRLPARWLFIRGNPFCGNNRSGSGTYDVSSSPLLPQGTRFLNIALFDGNDLPHAMTYSDSVYYPTDGTSLLNLQASGSGQYVLSGSTCSPPVYNDTINGTIPQYMGYTTSGGRRVYYIGSDSFFEYQFRSYEGAWHAGEYRQIEATFTADAKAALVSLVNYSISQLGLYTACSGQQASDLAGRVRVEYDLNNPAGDFDQLSFTFSSDGGASWSIVPNSAYLSGDSNMTDIVSGHYVLVWNAAQQLPANTFNSNFRVRLIATAGGVSITSISAPFTIDLRGLQGGLTVAGKVRNATTGQGLSGVAVGLAGQNTTTLSDGSYSFANVVLANGNTITASKSGFATYSGTISAPAGGVQSVPRDINLSLASGNKPVVTGIRAKYDGLFLSGVSLANEYTASIDWRGQTPSKVHFYWGRNSPQHVVVNTSSDQATTAIDMALGFQGSFTLGDNKLTVKAEDSTGQLSDSFIQNVAIIPMPPFLNDYLATAAALPWQLLPGNDPLYSFGASGF